MNKLVLMLLCTSLLLTGCNMNNKVYTIDNLPKVKSLSKEIYKNDEKILVSNIYFAEDSPKIVKAELSDDTGSVEIIFDDNDIKEIISNTIKTEELNKALNLTLEDSRFLDIMITNLSMYDHSYSNWLFEFLSFYGLNSTDQRDINIKFLEGVETMDIASGGNKYRIITTAIKEGN